MLLDYTVQALDRKSSGKDVGEAAQTKSEKETKVYKTEILSMQDPSQKMVVQAFKHISETSSAIEKEVKTLHAMAISQKSESTKISTASIQMLGETSPKILLKLQDLTVRCGDTAQLICALESENFSTVLWTHEGETIQESERIKLSRNGSVLFLTIFNVQLLDQGLYSCLVRNNFGEVTTSAVLTVEGGYLVFNVV